MPTVSACLLNVRLALRLQNVPTVHGKNVAAGSLLQCIASILISTLSWLLGYLDILEHSMNGARFLVCISPSSFSTRISQKKRRRESSLLGGSFLVFKYGFFVEEWTVDYVSSFLGGRYRYQAFLDHCIDIILVFQDFCL